MIRYIFTAFLLIVAVTVTAQSTIESVPNQKLINGSYVSNPDKILDVSTVAQIDTLLKSLEARTTAQVAVVVLESIGNEDMVDFAQRLFVAWGIGHNENNNGLLLLLVKDQRMVRFHTGYGLESTLPDVICKRIQRDYMVPEFKNENYNAGVLAGLQQVEKILSDPKYADEIKTPETNTVSNWTGTMIFLGVILGPLLLIVFIVKAVKGRFADSKKKKDTRYPEMRLKRLSWLVFYVAIPALIIILFGISSIEKREVWCVISLYMYFMATRFYRMLQMRKVINRFLLEQNYYEIVEFIRKQQWYWLWMALLFPFPFVFYFFYHLARKRLYRNHPRSCKQCKGDMEKLSEKTEDEYLSESMQLEEKLRTVDYDVWKCKDCQAVEMWFYLGRTSTYTSCPKCQTIAYYSSSRRTVKPASYSSSGSGEEVHTCKFCGHNHTTTYSIARLERSTSSSSSSFSSGSSGGGSWGGGSSGGGGASSRW